MNAKELLESKGIKDTLFDNGNWTKGALSNLMEEYAAMQLKSLNLQSVHSGVKRCKAPLEEYKLCMNNYHEKKCFDCKHFC